MNRELQVKIFFSYKTKIKGINKKVLVEVPPKSSLSCKEGRGFLRKIRIEEAVA